MDKLKTLLLNKDQILLFEYLPKPIILKNLLIDLDYKILSNTTSDIIPTNQTKKLGIEEELICKIKNVQRAYTNISTKAQMTPIDLKLIDMLDENMKHILKLDKISEPQLSSTRNLIGETVLQTWENLSSANEKFIIATQNSNINRI